MKIKSVAGARFEAAHFLPLHGGKCRGLHGHNYRLEVEVAGSEVQQTGAEAGMITDFSGLKNYMLHQVLTPLDHTLLNRHMDNPTAENVALWIWQRLDPLVARLSRVRLWETDDCYAEVCRE
jgi:6-pyruvoyltetrahydropterin/6-carboxytetrahydropterin synthase